MAAFLDMQTCFNILGIVSKFWFLWTWKYKGVLLNGPSWELLVVGTDRVEDTV